MVLLAVALVSVALLGFEYVECIEGQRMTKRQVGAKPLVMRCSG